MTTELQQERQQQAGQANLEAIQGINITPNQGAVVPNVMQLQGLLEQMQSAKNSLPNINPPSEDEIRKTSWIASGVIGLLGAIVSGNAAGGIAAGMVAALAIHDRGYDLRQRADLVPELHRQGYTARAILNWYETGDNKELDKEAQEREQLASRQATIDMQGEQLSQADRHFNVQQKNANDRFYSGQAAAESRFERSLATAEQRANKQLEAQSWAEIRPTIQQSQAKQAQLGMAARDLADLRHAVATNNKDAAAGAYNNYREHMARAVIGGTGMITKEMADEATQLPAWKDSEFAKWHLQGTGMPDESWMSAQQEQVSGALKNETETLTEIAKNAFNSQVAGGVNPDDASRSVNRLFQGAGIGTNDYTKPLPSDIPQKQEKSSGVEHVSPGGVKYTVKVEK
ncbi:hypothetical protein FNH88_19685 [Salmonella enterica subsp. salamae]|nr:hypothetical protein [Salmonella enterica subsp. salamae]